jgi:hypothetical protein
LKGLECFWKKSNFKVLNWRSFVGSKIFKNFCWFVERWGVYGVGLAWIKSFKVVSLNLLAMTKHCYLALTSVT